MVDEDLRVALAQLNGRWRKHVGDMTKGEAGHFTIVESFGGGGLSQTQADSRYAPKSHRHTATVDLR